MARRVSRFKKRTCDRSGFDFYERTLQRQGALLVSGDEYDVPPPSTKSLGGEGGVAQGDLSANDSFSVSDTATPASLDNPIQYVVAGTTIQPSQTHPFVLVSGSNGHVTITANPAIAAGYESQTLALVGAGSSVTLTHGNGVVMANSLRFAIATSSILVLMYHTGGTAWYETSRTRP